jgi:hypothetical protein
MRRRRAALLLLVTPAIAGCGSGADASGSSPGASSPTASSPTASIPAKLLAGLRPIGAGPRFHPAPTGRPTGGCRAAPGSREAHIELFGANRVVLIPAGVGHRGDCYGNAVTTDPTGVIHFRPGATLAELFRAWGQPLTSTRLASFTGSVRYYVAGHRVRGVGALTEHAQIVIEVGPYVPPHSSFTFPRGL